MIVVDIILWVFVALVVLVALLVLMPLHFRARGYADDDEGVDWGVRAAWAFGVVSLQAETAGIRLKLMGVTVHKEAWGASKDKREDKTEKKEKKKKKKKDSKKSRGLGWAKKNRSLLWSIVQRFVGALHLSGHIRGDVGLDRPDETAQLHQFLVALSAILPRDFLQVNVNWVEPQVSLDGALRSWVWPIQVLGIALGLFLNTRTRRALRAS